MNRKLLPRRSNSIGPILTAALAAFLVLPGCVGYQIGSTLPKDVKSVYVPTFENKTNEPFIEADVTREVITGIQRDGTLKVVNEAQADTVLKVTLSSFIFTPIAYNREHRTQANEYRLILTASYVLTHARTGKVISQHPRVQGETIASLVGDMSTSKRAALPEASKELAKEIVDRIVETWL